ncbi:hypothetical protein Ocin01_12471 [Orchesella cincta]|uniref:Transmembrane protein n=1 Tax=Orchesella cincta TaxID=48709 RepID=A0A1D2MMM7_ORCCI|nr:hypothetical protein Ocin01_12471 [Orchesella cincta]
MPPHGTNRKELKELEDLATKSSEVSPLPPGRRLCLSLLTGVKLVAFCDCVLSSILCIGFIVEGWMYLSNEGKNFGTRKKFNYLFRLSLIELAAIAHLWAAIKLFKYATDRKGKCGFQPFYCVNVCVYIYVFTLYKGIREQNWTIIYFSIVAMVFKCFEMVVVTVFKKRLWATEKETVNTIETA